MSAVDHDVLTLKVNLQKAKILSAGSAAVDWYAKIAFGKGRQKSKVVASKGKEAEWNQLLLITHTHDPASPSKQPPPLVLEIFDHRRVGAHTSLGTVEVSTHTLILGEDTPFSLPVQPKLNVEISFTLTAVDFGAEATKTGRSTSFASATSSPALTQSLKSTPGSPAPSGAPRAASFSYNPEDTDAEFAKLLDEMGLKGPQRDAMMKFSAEKKLAMLNQSSVAKASERKDEGSTPQAWARKLKAPAQLVGSGGWTLSTEDIKGLRVALGGEGMSWLKSFSEAGGFVALLDFLENLERHNNKANKGKRASIEQSTPEVSLQSEVVKCLKAFLNNKEGIETAMDTPGALRKLALCLGSGNMLIRTEVLQLLTVLCLLPPKGHRLAIDSQEYYQREKNEGQRFSHLLHGLKETRKLDTKVLYMAFINALVNSPEDIDLRMALRQEFYMIGIKDVLQTLRLFNYDDSPLLDTQIKVWEDEEANDEKDMASVYERLGALGIDLNNPDEVLQKLVGHVKPLGLNEVLLDIAKDLMVIPVDTPAGIQSWLAAGRVIRQFALHKALIGPDEEGQAPLENLLLKAEGAAKEVPLKSKIDDLGKEIADLQKKNQTQALELQEKEKAFKNMQNADQAEEIKKLKEVMRAQEEKVRTLEDSLAEAKSQAEQAEASLARLKAEPRQAPPESPRLQAEAGSDAPAEGSGGPPPPPPPGLPPPPPMLAKKKLPGIAKLAPSSESSDTASSEPTPEASGGPPPPPSGPPPPPPPMFGKKKPAAAAVEEGEEPSSGGGGPPPPPPPPGMKGPPGPPPPPGMKGKGPPPPPGGLGKKAGASAKTAVPTPVQKMKGLQWTTVPERKVAGTVFAEFGDSAKILGEAINFSDLENQFQAKVIEKKAGDAAPKKAGPVQILDPKTAQKSMIWLSQFKGKSHDDICQGLIRLDESMFTVENIDGLIPLVPTADDITNIQEFLKEGNDASRLGPAEQFALKLNEVPQLALRLASFKYKLVFPLKKADLKINIESFRLGCKELRSCTRLQKMLEVILVLGNFLNGGTNRGGAIGFKLNTLNKLGDTKATDNKTSLMHYLVKLVESKFPDLMHFDKDLPHIDAASKVSMSMMQSEIATLKKDFVAVEKNVETVKSIGQQDKFQQVMREFVSRTAEDLDTMNADLTQIDADFKTLAGFFGEDPKIDPAEFLVIFVKFADSYGKTREENAQAVLQAEKIAKREAAAKAKEEEAERKKKAAAENPRAGNRVGGGPTNVAAKQEAVVDELLSTITAGDAFKNRRRAAAPRKVNLDIE
eukprot:TRINITY_DN1020_c0_g1_i1.p1 TRINITY_DN1020_c0_g1~~TRINITY_DN1020_c0_g1_i1.p1  ORF type:complete len:1287 (+),score=454.62 TRINITY_DN1020_c0_g1_i1:105-3965(+)